MENFNYKFFKEDTRYICENKSNIIINKEEYNKLKNISLIDFVKLILNNPKYKQHINDIFNGKLSFLQFSYYENSRLNGSEAFSKLEIIKLLKSIKTNPELTKKELEQIHEYEYLTSMDTFINTYVDKLYTETIDGTPYMFEGQEIISLITMTDNDYSNLIEKRQNDRQFQALYYMTRKFLRFNDIHLNFELNENILNRIKRIINYNDFDTEALNELTYQYDQPEAFTVNQELEEYILKDIPSNYSLVEKAIYLYLKMSTTFQYDEEYGTFTNEEKRISKHKDPNYISSLTINNNELVCYEFCALYGYFLNKIGIFYEIERKGSQIYGNGHEAVRFRANKFLIKADSLKAILESDLINVKMHKALNGLTCVNKNNNTFEEFEIIKEKVYEKFQNSLEYRAKYYQDISSYEALCLIYGKDSEILTLKNRIKMMIEYVETSNLNKIEIYNYFTFLIEKLFTEEEQENNIEIHYLKNSRYPTNEKPPTYLVLIIVNDDKIIKSSPNNTYYLYDIDLGLKEVSLNQLKLLFQGKISYLNEFDYLNVKGL